MKRKIEHRFCGGCNPLYDRNQVYTTVCQALKEESMGGNSDFSRIILLYNGCRCGCIQEVLEREQEVKIINIQRYLIDSQGRIHEEALIRWILDQI